MSGKSPRHAIEINDYFTYEKVLWSSRFPWCLRSLLARFASHSRGLRSKDLGFEMVAEDFYKVFFREVELGEFDVEALRFRPVQVLR